MITLPPSCLSGFAPQLDRWLAAWTLAKKVVLPGSKQLLTQISQRAPNLNIEVAWRFDKHLKGLGVEVICHGRSVRKIGEEELVVLGDAPLPCAADRLPYLEVRLDEMGEALEDNPNDFGFGVTASNPSDICDLGEVADEVPMSWVVDFTQSMVCLSVNNREAARGRRLCASDLKKGSRVGLLLKQDGVEVYIDGLLRETLTPKHPEERIPQGIGLYPVLDLYGRTIQISRTNAEEPVP